MTRTSRSPLRVSRKLLLENLEVRWVPAAVNLVPDELLVSFRPGTPEVAMEQARGAVRGSVAEVIHTAAMASSGAQPIQLLRLNGMAVENAVAALAKNPNVAFAEPNYLYTKAATSNDPYFTGGSLWGMQGGYGSNAQAAWAADYTGSRSVYVGIIDEGYQFTHPDLAANAAVNPGEIAGDGIDNDGNGLIDDVRGWDFANNDNTVYDGTGDDHGTHVAGTIGGVGGNSTGVVGVNWSVSLLDAKFLGANGGTTANAIKAVDYFNTLKDKGVNIVATNNSWGGGGYSQGLYDAIQRANQRNILFVAAAGNSSLNMDATISYPAGYSNPNIISVAAIDSAGNLASFSNYGATTVDIGAPGVGIWSSVPSNTYNSYSGTSMATPHVTGAVALYASVYPGSTAAQIKDAILNSGAPTGSLSGKTVTGDRLDVWAALQYGGALPPPAPQVSISDVSANEGATGTVTSFTFTITLSKAVSGGLTLNWSTADGSATVANADYQAALNQALVFSATETSKTITVLVNGDATVEANEVFYVRLSLASGTTGVDLAKAQGTGTIVNDDSSTSGGGKGKPKTATATDLTLLDAALITLLTDQGKKTA